MASITLEVENDLAAALSARSKNLRMSVEELSQTVLEQWLLDQGEPELTPWSDDDLAAIETAKAQARDGQTISHQEARTRLLAKVS